MYALVAFLALLAGLVVAAMSLASTDPSRAVYYMLASISAFALMAALGVWRRVEQADERQRQERKSNKPE